MRTCKNCQTPYERPLIGAPGLCPACKGPHRKAYFTAYRKQTRYEALQHYGGICRCCGEYESAFLALDHINGGGNAHRRLRKGDRLCQWLKSHGWPEGYQVLCHNCNSAKSIYGYCPHDGIQAKTRPLVSGPEAYSSGVAGPLRSGS